MTKLNEGKSRCCFQSFCWSDYKCPKRSTISLSLLLWVLELGSSTQHSRHKMRWKKRPGRKKSSSPKTKQHKVGVGTQTWVFDSLILIFPSPADSFWGIFSRLIMRLWFCKVMKEVGVCPIEHLSNSQTKEEDTGEEKEKIFGQNRIGIPRATVSASRTRLCPSFSMKWHPWNEWN